MSLYGIKPTASVGENFRSSVWLWRPLWQYVNSLGLLTNEQYMQGCVNDGECVRCVERQVWCGCGKVWRAGVVHAAGGGGVWSAVAAAMGLGAGVGWVSDALSGELVRV